LGDFPLNFGFVGTAGNFFADGKFRGIFKGGIYKDPQYFYSSQKSPVAIIKFKFEGNPLTLVYITRPKT
jgi:hypothetical protein